eukprot:200755-Pelagomonas_calceolata.AAC.3
MHKHAGLQLCDIETVAGCLCRTAAEAHAKPLTWMVCVRPPVSIRVPGICATHDVQGVFCVYVYIEEQCPEKLTSKMQPSVASTVKTEEREPTLLIEFSRVVCTMI